MLTFDSTVDLAKHYRFDGWFINLEAPLPKEHIADLLEFLKYLTERIHMEIPGSLVVWYDALTIEGDIKWQNKLTLLNKVY